MTIKTIQIDAEKARMLRGEISKVRCWLSGFGAGRYGGDGPPLAVPGEDSLRQIVLLLDDGLSKMDK